jgi:two-component system, NtrC family, response regulator AtoC
VACILIIDDEEIFCRNTVKFLQKFGHTANMALDARSGLVQFSTQQPDLVILDYRLPDVDGISVIRQLRELDSEMPILMITGHGSIELAVEAMKAGASDLLTKPVPLADLQRRIEAFASRQRQSGRLRYFESKERLSAKTIIGNSVSIREVRDRITRIAAVEGSQLPPVLILGETGTGKELVARALHFESNRSQQPFIEINCASIPDGLLESELFGHERGAFTDARERKIGLIEAADGGTLFLDEIGEMNLALQAKLLKVLEDGRFRRLGSVQERQANLRILAATHKNLEELIHRGQFRSDLYFRLRVLRIFIPSLRQRGDDVLLLTKHFLALFTSRYGRNVMTLSPAAESALRAHDWPGNVRELRNVIEQAVLLTAQDVIDCSDLMLPIRSIPASTAGVLPASEEQVSMIDGAERDLIVRALSLSAGNVTRAARELGLSRDTLRYRIEKHGLR